MRSLMRKTMGGMAVTSATLQRPRRAPWPPQFTLSKELIDRLREIERLDQQVQSLNMTADAERRLRRESLARNAYGTASIEGNALSLDEVRSLLAKAPTPSTQLEPDEREILRHAKLIDGLAEVRPPISVENLCHIHAEYFRGILPRAGAVKKTPNFVGNARNGTVHFIPTAPPQTATELRRALAWFHSAAEHPLVRVALFFHEFQSIHPFPDGNGRLGRLLATIQLWHAGYRGVRLALVDFAINESRDEYYAALDAARRPGWDRTPWLEFFAGIVHEAYSLVLRRALLQAQLPKGLNERQVRIVEWAARISRADPRRAWKLADVHEAVPTTPRRTLTADLSLLVAKGVLQREGERKAARYRLTESMRRSRAA